MEEIKTSNTGFSLINEDLINCGCTATNGMGHICCSMVIHDNLN